MSEQTAPQTVTCQLRMPDCSAFYGQIEANAKYAKRMLAPNCHTGKSVVIVGAGPSLAEEYPRLPQADHVWACNSALPYLMDRKVRVTHGFAIDQHPAMLDAHEWARTFDVGYYVATSVHPTLVEHLRAKHRKITFFHNYLGVPEPEGWNPLEHGMPADCSYELYLYRTKFDTSVQVGHGLNSVPRAVCLAIATGFSSITVVGADCACAPDSPIMPDLQNRPNEYADWMTRLVMYADGRTASQYGTGSIMAEATIDGTRWHTRPDMVVSARHLVDLVRAYPGRVHLVGKTLANAFLAQSPEWMADLPRLTDQGEVVGFGNASDRPTDPSLTLAHV